MNTTLIDAARQNPKMIVSIELGDLMEANSLLLEQARAQLEQKIADANAECYYTTEKVKEILSVCTSTLWRWEKRGYLVPINFGGQKRYRKSDIEKILEGAA